MIGWFKILRLSQKETICLHGQQICILIPLSQHLHTHNLTASIIYKTTRPGIWRERWAETFGLRETGNQTALDCWFPDCRYWNHLGQNCGLCWFGRRLGFGRRRPRPDRCSAGSYLDDARLSGSLRVKWATRSRRQGLVVVDAASSWNAGW